MVRGPPPTFPHGSSLQLLSLTIWQNLHQKTHPLREGRGAARQKALTFRLDLQCRADQGKEGGVEGDRAIAVQGHVHAHQPL